MTELTPYTPREDFDSWVDILSDVGQEQPGQTREHAAQG